MSWRIAGGMLATLWVAGITVYLGTTSRPTASEPLQPRLPPQQIVAEHAPEPDDAALVPIPDLTKIDRQLIEPPNLIKPRYCLLVFGLQAETRVWLMLDGDMLYVDCNANGDLTDASKAFHRSELRDFPSTDEDGKPVVYREWSYQVGDIVPADHSSKHTNFAVKGIRSGNEPAKYIVSVRVDGRFEQLSGWMALFATSRQQASVIHFGGPLVARSLRSSSLQLRTDDELHFCVGTPGLGKGSFAYLSYEAVPATIRPVVGINWPTAFATFQDCYSLAERC
jgi:hypothetical protein